MKTITVFGTFQATRHGNWEHLPNLEYGNNLCFHHAIMFKGFQLISFHDFGHLRMHKTSWNKFWDALKSYVDPLLEMKPESLAMFSLLLIWRSSSSDPQLLALQLPPD